MSCHLFADDVQLYRCCTLSDVVDCIGLINGDLGAVNQWAFVNKLQLNASKSCAIIIYVRDIPYHNLPQPRLGGEVISYSDRVKNLGVVFNKTLTWDAHVDYLTVCVYGILRRFWLLAYATPINIRRKLVVSLILPYFLYCDVVLSSMSSEVLGRLNVLFNSCTRYVFGLRRYDHLSEFRTNILGCDFNTFLKYRYLLFLFKILRSKSPSYLYGIIRPGQSSRAQNLIVFLNPPVGIVISPFLFV